MATCSRAVMTAASLRQRRGRSWRDDGAIVAAVGRYRRSVMSTRPKFRQLISENPWTAFHEYSVWPRRDDNRPVRSAVIAANADGARAARSQHHGQS